MFNKKYFFILLLLLVSVTAIAGVSAADVNETDEVTLSDDENMVISQDNEIYASGDEAILANEEDSTTTGAVENEDKVSDGENQASIIANDKTFNYGTNALMTAQLVDGDGNPISGTIGKLAIAGKTFSAKTDAGGKVTLTIKNLAKGKYTAIFSTDSPYEASKKVHVTIKGGGNTAKAINLIPTKLTTTYASGKTFNVRAVDSSGSAVGGVKIKVVIYTGSKYNVAYITTKSNGYATLAASKLSIGTHKIVVSSANSNYKASAKTSYVKINKKPLLITAKRIYGSKFGAVHIKVADKATKKMLNGIKLSLSIYTGSAVKRYILVTGYDGKIYKSNGVAAIESNQFSTGYHKVVISVLNAYCQGSATSILKIPALAKGVAKYTGIITNGQAKKL